MTGISPIGAISGIQLGAPNAATAVTGADSTGLAGSISTVGAGTSIDGSSAGDTPGSSFLNALGDAFGQLNTQLQSADSAMSGFAAGGSADLHTVMLQMEEASVSLKAGVAVRDKLLEAYQEIMRTQV